VPALLLLVVGSAALLWRRARPVMVLSVVVSAYVMWHLLGYIGSPSLAIVVAMYGVGRYVGDLRPSVIAPAAATLAIVATAISDRDPMTDVAVALTLVPLVPWYIGRRVAARRQHVRLLEERTDFLERQRAAELRQVLEEERRSIARELHDVVAHRVSLMTVQASAAQAIVDQDPARAAQSMMAVEDAGRAALDELRHLLDVLGPRPGEQPRSPAASLAKLGQVAERMQDAGLGVTLEADGVPETLPTRVELSAFRIVQESLTNALRYAGPGAHATVRLGVEDNELQIRITDDGPGPRPSGRIGRGIAGMRERAELLGGHLETGPGEAGGFCVRAVLPLAGRAQ
jgi:signal transduction histidine kinase